MKLRSVIAILVLTGALGVWASQRYSLPRRGERIFAQRGCTGCHFSGAGPNLTHVMRKHDRAVLEKLILDSPAFYRARKGEPLNPGYMRMPKVNATPDEIHAILAYLQELDEN